MPLRCPRWSGATALSRAYLGLLTVGGQGRGVRSFREGFAGRGRRGAGSRAGCGGRLSRAATRNLPEERSDGEGTGGRILEDALWKEHVCISRSYASPRQEGTFGDTIAPLLRGGSPPRPRRQPPAHPRRASLAKALCHRSVNETLPEARSVYK